MLNTAEIKNLSRTDKLKMMEALWEDLSHEEGSVESPSWHRDALLETESRVGLGQEKTFDWHEAKKELRKSFE